LKYNVFDLVIQSDFELPELEVSFSQSTDITLTIKPGVSGAREFDWFHYWHDDGQRSTVVAAIARIPVGFVLRFPGLADFLISEDCKKVACEPVTGTSESTLRHLLLDQVLPRILGQAGHLVIHASAVEKEQSGGVAFCGESGWGKSTLAASFQSEGFRFVSDDCLKLAIVGDSLMGIPAYAGGRLMQDSIDVLQPGAVNIEPVAQYSSKRRFKTPGKMANTGIALGAVFFLQDPVDCHGDEVQVIPMSGTEAIMGLIKHSFLLDAEDRQATRRRFMSLQAFLMARPMFYSLAYPRDYSRLDEVKRTIKAVMDP
jgi:hypothetical protein